MIKAVKVILLKDALQDVTRK